MVRTWDGLGDRGESNDRGPSSYKTRSSQLSSEADISNPATVKFKSGQWLRKPASTPAAYEPIRMTAGSSKTRPPTEAASHVLISRSILPCLGGHPEPNKDAEADGQYPIMLQKAEG